MKILAITLGCMLCLAAPAQLTNLATGQAISPGTNISNVVVASGGGGGCTPAYVTGDRTATVTSSVAVLPFGGSVASLVNGDTSSADCFFFGGYDIIGDGSEEVKWDFVTACKITEVTVYSQGTHIEGTWEFQGSANGSTGWVDLGANFTLGESSPQVITSPSGNTSTYRYYRFKGISGNINGAICFYEVQFKTCTP